MRRLQQMGGRQEAALPVLALLLLGAFFELGSGQGQQGRSLTSDTVALLSFRDAVDPAKTFLPWDPKVNTCLWPGIKCDALNTRVQEIRQPGAGIVGSIPLGTLGVIDQLRVVSLRKNGLTGGLPSDLANCTKLRAIYLQENRLSGPLPDVGQWLGLVHLDLSSNAFSGDVPPSINKLTKLKTLFLQNNALQGSVPKIDGLTGLQNLSLANNNLTGAVDPALVDRFGEAAFLGNPLICGVSFGNSCVDDAAAPAAAAKGKKSGISVGAIVAIIAGNAAFLLLVTAALLCWYWRRRSGGGAAAAGEPKDSYKDKAYKSEEFKDDSYSSIQEPERNKLVFFEGKRFNFDLEDLLRASAEVLGKGSVGTAYKAVLEDGSTVAVKRLKDVSTGPKDFEHHIEMVGRLHHPNLVPLRAYYYSKDEKLLVYDYLPRGSLSALLHGNRGAGRTPLNWVSRVRIALGSARGIAYLHDEAGSSKFTHGNIKSSNILLNRNFEACVSDFGLVQLLSTSPSASRVVGYRAPEVTETRKVTQRADVYSFGVLLLELLTGKAPTQSSLNDEGIDLPRWVQSVVREEWTAEVFDLELMRYQNIEEEMVQMLQIAMACVATAPDQRPKMRQVVKMLEEIRPLESDDAARSYDKSDDKSREFDRPELYTPGSEASESFTHSASYHS